LALLDLQRQALQRDRGRAAQAVDAKRLADVDRPRHSRLQDARSGRAPRKEASDAPSATSSAAATRATTPSPPASQAGSSRSGGSGTPVVADTRISETTSRERSAASP